MEGKARKNMRGEWTATSYRIADGKDWEIATFKGNNGTLITRAQAGQLGADRRGFSYAMFTDPHFSLITEKTRATDKTVQDQHDRGLLAFEALVVEKGWSTDVKFELQPGQIVFLNGYGKHEGNNRLAIYEAESGTFGKNYRVVCLETFEIKSLDRITNVKDKKGETIGHYFREGQTVTVEEAQEAAKKGLLIIEEKDKARKDKAAEAARVTAELLAKGQEIVPAAPVGATHLIIAERRRNDSDIQTDYFASSVEEVVYLAWSRHGRDLFDEMRKAAANCDIPEVSKYAVKPTPPEGADLEFWQPKDEHREKYSMGSGYYLADHSYSGWHIKKERIREKTLELVQIAAGAGRYYCPSPDLEETAAPSYEPVPVTAGAVQVVDYSAKAIAVIGDTKPIKEKLKSLGGRFNFRLSCGPGWIFSKTKLPELCKALGISGTGEAPQSKASEADPAAGMIQANEEAYFDNFSALHG